ncbi:EAL domain-containing protein [Alteromonas macleodii]|uniref:EAL domain-containing protein n=1 Tax=Alteromonas macleodii TaxID=28108 RepID=UPI001F0AD19F|nr:EAL domain-containing protein [Alteromonas macleodii]|tara:strand:- start:76365 stop:79211 length:2847 start_codon:yes stop_codon:yes gene_type:complete
MLVPISQLTKYVAALLISWVVLSINAFASPRLVIDESFEREIINHYARVSIAPNSATYFDVLTGSSTKTPTATASSTERVWYSTELVHSGYSAIPLVLNIDRLNVDDLQIYLLDSSQRIIKSYRYQAGKGDYSLRQPLPNIRLAFTLQPYQDARLLIAVKDEGLKYFPMSLWERDLLTQHDTNMLTLLGAVSGVMALIASYFLFSYLYQRIPTRFWLTMSSLVLIALLFITEGGLAFWPSLTNASEHFYAVCFGVLLLCIGKVTHHLFSRVPFVLRLLNYALPIAATIYCFTVNAYMVTITLLILTAAMGLYHVTLALIFKDKGSSVVSTTYILAWLSFFAFYALVTQNLFSDLIYTVDVAMGMLFFLTLGFLCFGFAVITKEQVLNQHKLSSQAETISSLNHFYDLFRNSAEGHYTSTWDGKLISVNPAMCKVFGYENEEEMLSEGASTKAFYASPEDRHVLLGEISQQGHVTRKEIRGKRRDGTEFWFSLSCQIRENDEGTYLYGSIIDITEKKQSDLSLQYLATHDSLTGVYNRRQFESVFKEKVHNHSALPVCLLFLDLDRFKVVNDTCGHKAGDVLIKDVARLIENTLLPNAQLARLGGDEFGVIYSDLDADAVYLNAVKILNAVQAYRFMWDNRIFNLGVSIGMVVCDDSNVSSGQYLSMADAACYFAKEQGRNQVHRYNKDDESMQRYQRELDWVSSINNALEEGRFELYYQSLRPLSKASDGHYYEVLLRLREKDGKIVEPANFLPTAERFEMNVNVDKWVVTNTFKWLSENPEHLAELRRCSINLNCHSLADRDFTLFILNAFETFNIPYNKICFEVIESVAIIKMEDTLAFMRTFNRLGCSFALDDFGSGFSSYSYLKSLPVNQVKIDGMFIKDMLNDSVDTAMVASINDVAKAMGMQTVGEFVENEGTMAQLGKMGVDFAQGYSVAKPAPLREFTPL